MGGGGATLIRIAALRLEAHRGAHAAGSIRTHPLCSPMQRIRASAPEERPRGIETSAADSGWEGTARTARTVMQSSGSKESMRMVLSNEPTARKRERCRPAGMVPISRQVTW